MEFKKYEQRGAYHWEEWEAQTTYGKYADTIPNWVKEDNVLDVGAGDGLITHLLGAIGIDDNPVAVKLATEKGVDVREGTAYDLPFRAGQFDAVFMGDTIEHLKYPDVALTEAYRVLKPNGYLYITTPPSIGDQLQDPYHYREYTVEELIEEVEACGFAVTEEPTVAFSRIYARFQRDESES